MSTALSWTLYPIFSKHAGEAKEGDMTIFRKALHKLWMGFIRLALKVLPSRKPMLFVGEGSSRQLANQISVQGHKHILLVSDANLFKLGLHKPCMDRLRKLGVKVTRFGQISPNPTEDQIEDGAKLAREQGCDAILAIGGGSPMDAAKVMSVRLTNTKTVPEMEGGFKIKNEGVPLYVIPTTAGTGSEVTVGAVVSNPSEQRKYMVADPKLAPVAAALDPALTRDLPKFITATTGMDALTHAIEAYLSQRRNNEVIASSLAATRLVFTHLRTAYRRGTNSDARDGMAMAAYYGGVAITYAGVGHVHAIAHQLGGLYHTPHGLANAVLLPHVLEAQRSSVDTRLAELARHIGLGQEHDDDQTLAALFIAEVRQLNKDLAIPETLAEMKSADIAEIIRRATDEVYESHDVPCYLKPAQIEMILQRISGA